jgi:hypothetical protein
MVTYRLVWRDSQGNASRSAQVECATDRGALTIAEQQLGDSQAVEVWDAFRPVGRVGNIGAAPTASPDASQ